MSYGVRRRARKADQFVQIDNAFLRDEQLSIEARGVGAYLLTHSLGFVVSAAALGRACGTGRDKTRRILKELENAGYLVRDHERENGRFVEDSFSMSDEKMQVTPQTEQPLTENQSPATSAPYKKTNSENTREEEDQVKTLATADAATDEPKPSKPASSKAKSAGTAAELDAEFEAWWKVWPKKVSKGTAERAYRSARRAGDVTADELLAAIEPVVAAWKADPMRRVFIPHPATWLNGKRWLDEYVPPRSPAGVQPLGVVHTAEEREAQEVWFAEHAKADEALSEEEALALLEQLPRTLAEPS